MDKLKGFVPVKPENKRELWLTEGDSAVARYERKLGLIEFLRLTIIHFKFYCKSVGYRETNSFLPKKLYKRLQLRKPKMYSLAKCKCPSKLGGMNNNDR